MEQPERSLRRSAKGRSGGRLLETRTYLYHILEDFDGRPSWSQPIKISVAGGMTLMILMSLVCLVLETEPALASTPPEVWSILEAVTTCAFTLEYLLRLWVCDVHGLSMVAWALRPMNVCDFLAIVPFYAEFFVTSDISWLRVLRVVRLVKFGRYSQGVQVMTMALVNSMQALYILIFLFMMGMVIFASTVYFTEKFSCPEFGRDKDLGLRDFRLYNEECAAGGGTGSSPTFGTCCAYQCRFLPSPTPTLCQYEWQDSLHALSQPGRRLLNTTAGADNWEVTPMHELAFSSVFTAMWWACVTMTTVGYGDIVPQNWISRCVASVAMLTGMLIIAMPFAIVGAKFGEAVAVCEAGNARHQALARLQKVKQFGGLRSSPSQSMDDKDQKHFQELKKALKVSLELKQEILRVQQLRDNLWTSVEHAMANFTLEGINSLSHEILKEDKSVDPLDDEGLCEWSCFVFHRYSKIRKAAIWVTHSTVFEYVVLMAILANSAIMANLDYYPRAVLPWENKLHERTEVIFIVLFTCECAIKIVARGFILDQHSYLRDAWNWIDFVVVIAGLALMIAESSLGAAGNSTDLSILRVVRVLRPLRTLSVLPGLRKLVNTILSSLPGLKDVVLMAFFLMATFGILGLQLYGGVMHRRCRLTPQPLHFTQRALEPTCSGWCFDNSSLITVDLGGRSSTPLDAGLVFGAFCSQVPACLQAFNEGRDYYVWPVEPSQERFCGEYQCKAVDGADTMAGFAFSGTNGSELVARVLEPMGAMEDSASGRQLRTTCGSPFSHDEFFAPGVANSELLGVNLDSPESEVNSSSFNWGLTHYDQIGGASLVVFQCVTLEGWVDIMYMLQDAYSGPLGFFYFLLLIIIGYFFLLNVILAIVYDAFCIADVSHTSTLEDAMSSANLTEDAKARGRSTASSSSAFRLLRELDAPDEYLHSDSSRRGWTFVKESLVDAVLRLLRRKRAWDVDAIMGTSSSWRIRNWARRIASSIIFDTIVMLVISANVVVLSLGRFPTNMLLDRFICEELNRVCNAMFLCELVILHVAIGPLVYWCDNAMAFDGVIVLLSLPDEIYKITGASSGGGSLQAVRAFRLLRIFKLAKKFRSMKVLLRACIETLLCMREFVMLLSIVVCVFALIGQSFFGGKFLFDPADGGVVKREEFSSRCPFGSNGMGKPDCVPRAHFDTFLWSVVTIFQILTGENWNMVMYDGMRATQWYALFFFLFVIIIGQFVILNLCLSILMMNFECHRNTIAAVEKEKKRRAKSSQKRLSAIAVVAHLQGGIDSGTSEDGQAGSEPPSSSESLTKRSGTMRAIDKRLNFKNAMAATSQSTRSFFSSWGRQKPSSSKTCPSLDSSDHEASAEEIPTSSRSISTPCLAEPANKAWAQQASPQDLSLENISEDNDVHPQQQQRPLLQIPAGHSSSSSAGGPDSSPMSPSEASPAPQVGLPGRVPDEHRGASSSSSSAAPCGPVRPPDDPELEPADPAPTAAADTAKRSTADSSKKSSERQGPHPNSDIPNLERLSETIQKATHCGSLGRRSCFIFDDAHPLRHLCLFLAKDSRFDQVIIALITVSSALMMLQNPLHDPTGTKEVVLGWANVGFTIVFAMEMVIKMTAFGMFCGQPGRPAYLHSSWNILDAFIVTVSLADVLQTYLTSDDGGVLGFLKIFRIARVLRPLRLISRNENLKVVVKTIVASLPELRNLSVFSSLFFLIFALLGVSNLKGSFYRCLDHTLSDYSFEQLGGVTPLCVPPVASAQARSADIDSAMRFTRQEAAGSACPANWTSWQRPTVDTPICEVHCSSEASNPFCTRDDRPWGYHTMRCTDCSQEFCPDAGANAEQADTCRQFCDRHEYFCQDTSDSNRSACLEQCVAECLCPDRCVGLSKDAALCAEQGGRWINMDQNFNDLGMGMISLFEICTTEGWVDLMLASADFRGPYLQPQRDSHELLACLLSVAFILIGSFFVLNLCVGVIVDNYHKQKESRSTLMVTQAQSNWIAYQKALYAKRTFFVQTSIHLLPPTRRHLMRIVTSPTFESSIMACIIMNTIVMGLVIYPKPSDAYVKVLSRLNIIFAVIFNIEAVMKLCAMHLNYFKERWNVFDFTCVLVSDIFLILEAVVDGTTIQVGDIAKGIRIFRIARLFRLVRFLKGLNQLTMAFVVSVPKLANVAFIMLLLIYLFAVLGVNLFAEVAYIDGRSYNDNANFRSFWQAMSLLIRSMTGEGWNALMHDLSKDKFYFESYVNQKCVDGLSVTAANFRTMDADGDGVVDPEFINGCGKQAWAFVYFITYTLIVTFVILNLFIAVIFDGFEESSKSEVSEVLEKCRLAWRKYDPDNTMLVSMDSALDFIDEVVDRLCHVQAMDEDPNFTMESRWDPSYKGMRNQAQPLALYNLRYMRIIGLRLTASNEVRFVVAVKGVIRRMICQGGFNPSNLSKQARTERLRELEELDRLMTSSDIPHGLDKELGKLRQSERRQARAIKSCLRGEATFARSSIATTFLRKSRVSSASSMSIATTDDDDERFEFPLLHEVAAAKIQRRFKEAFQRRRARSKGGAAHDPIARAAG